MANNNLSLHHLEVLSLLLWALSIGNLCFLFSSHLFLCYELKSMVEGIGSCVMNSSRFCLFVFFFLVNIIIPKTEWIYIVLFVLFLFLSYYLHLSLSFIWLLGKLKKQVNEILNQMSSIPWISKFQALGKINCSNEK